MRTPSNAKYKFTHTQILSKNVILTSNFKGRSLYPHRKHTFQILRAFGIKMNAKKTEIMVIGKDTSQHPLPEIITIDITVNGNSAKRVTHFTHFHFDAISNSND